MKRMIMVILIVAVFAGIVQAHTRVIIPGNHCYPVIHRYPWYSCGGYYGHYGHYDRETQRVAVVGSIGLGVLDTVIRAGQEDKAIKIAERQQELQQQQIAAANAAREEQNQMRAENEKLRLENERLQLELKNQELRKKLETTK